MSRRHPQKNMVMRQLLGSIDVLCAIVLLTHFFGNAFPTVQATLAFVIIAKGIFFIHDVASVVDVIIGIIMFILLWISSPIIALLCALYLGVKGTYSVV